MENKEELQKEYDEITEKLYSQESASDGQNLQELSRRHSELAEILELYKKIDELEKAIEENENIIKTEEEELVELAKEEAEEQKQKKKKLQKELKKKLNPAPGSHIKEAIVEIRAGVGGDEAALFAQDLFRMYTRYAELNNWKTAVLEKSSSTLDGLKEVVFEVKGDGVYSKLRNESGVHRVQRIPQTEKSGRIHTSTASVAVLPKAKPVDINIKTEDLRVDTYRSSGPGGQNVNKVATAVRVTHVPTGTIAASQSSKSQAQNKEIAMTILRSKMLEKKQKEEEEKMKKERKSQIGTAQRSEKIRTYNFPQDRVTDHRINKSWHSIERVMDGTELGKILETLEEA